jgi:thioredoxin 1
LSELQHINDKNYESLVSEPLRPALLDFGATWCGPCKALEPSIAALAKQYGDRVTIGKLDIDESQEVAMRFGIMSVPTVVMLKEGKEVHRFSGVPPKEKIAQLIETHLLAG